MKIEVDGETLTVDLVVTRHEGLIRWLEAHYGPIDVPVKAQVGEEDVKGKVVLGILPLHLAAEARAVVTIPLTVPHELRGRELSIEEMEPYVGKPEGFKVLRVGLDEEYLRWVEGTLFHNL